MRIVTVIGARPQFIKAAIVSRALKKLPDIEEQVVHTGQHYDEKMSQVFFDELDMPRPLCNLQIGSGSHGQQTGKMLARLEEVFQEQQPQLVVVYGDTNTTLAAALAAAKLHIPIAHIEAGLRSFNRRMPEEINRVLTDHVASLMFCPTEPAVANLAREGLTDNVHLVGDVMYDAAVFFAAQAESFGKPLADYDVQHRQYALLTCHRAENTDDPTRLHNILTAAKRLAAKMPVVFPVHPRTRKKLNDLGLSQTGGLSLIEPVSYLDMLLLERNASLVLTDSGGVQKEAFFFGVPCVTLRDETEWVETIACGANQLVGADADLIVKAACAQITKAASLPDAGQYYGYGEASRRTAGILREFVERNASLVGPGNDLPLRSAYLSMKSA